MSWDPYCLLGGWGVLFTIAFSDPLGSIGWARPRSSPQEKTRFGRCCIFTILTVAFVPRSLVQEKRICNLFF